VGLSEVHKQKPKFFYFEWCARKSFYGTVRDPILGRCVIQLDQLLFTTKVVSIHERQTTERK